MTKKEVKNYYRAKVVIVILGIVAFLAALGWAGDMDYTDQCILNMSYEEYDTIKAKLTQEKGREPSESEIAHYWAEHVR